MIYSMSRDLKLVYSGLAHSFDVFQKEMQKIKPVFVIDAFRSDENQDYLYSLGRDIKDKKIVTNARAGESYHNYGLAIDFAFKDTNPFCESHPWKIAGTIAKALGFEWGGDFRSQDLVHLQKSYDFSIEDLKKIKQEIGIQGIFRKIDNIRGL
jgi:hypothetical protein